MGGSEMVHKLYEHIAADGDVKSMFETEAPAAPAPVKEEKPVAEAAPAAKEEKKEEKPAAACEGKVPNPDEPTEGKIAKMIEGFVILDKSSMSVIRESGKVKTFESAEKAESYASEKGIKEFRVFAVKEGEVASQPSVPKQVGKLPAGEGASKTEKIPAQNADVPGEGKAASSQTTDNGGAVKAENAGDGSPEAKATKSQSIAQAAGPKGQEKEASQREMISDSKIKEYAEMHIVSEHLQEQAKSRALSEKEQAFITKVSTLQFESADLAKIEEAKKKMKDKMKAKKEKKAEKK